MGWSKTRLCWHKQRQDKKTYSSTTFRSQELGAEEQRKEFKKIQREQYELFLHKQHDYGPGNISVGTQLQTPEEVRLSLMGLFFRMNDKIQRVKTLLMNNRESAVKDEPLEEMSTTAVNGIRSS